jgi:hypothetical protein
VKTFAFDRLVRLAKSAPEDGRVPFAFEKRIMTRLRSVGTPDSWAAWVPTMRKAAICGLAVFALASVFVRYTQERPSDLLAGDLERTVLASVHIEETW